MTKHRVHKRGMTALNLEWSSTVEIRPDVAICSQIARLYQKRSGVSLTFTRREGCAITCSMTGEAP